MGGWIRRRSVWSEQPALTERLIELWNVKELSATQCMAELGNGLSRNAILGRVMRLRDSGIPMISAPVHVQKPRAPRPPRIVPPKIVVVDPATLQPIVLENGEFVTVDNARRCHCRYVYGDPTIAYQFCGRQVTKGSFCDSHSKLCHQPKHPATQDVEAA